VTYNTKPTNGGKRGDTLDLTNGSSTGAWKTLDITDIYYDWKNGNITNNGMYLYLEGITPISNPANVTFDSQGPGSSYAPYLRFEYITDTDEVFVSSSADWASTYNTIGVACNTGNATGNIVVQSSGIYPKQSGLTANTIYYLTTAGNIATTPGTYNLQVGKALSATRLLLDFKGIDVQNCDINGTTAAPVFVSGEQYRLCGFNPRKITIFGTNGADYLGNASSMGTQIGSSAFCVYTGGNDTAQQSGQSTTYSFYVQTDGNNLCIGDITPYACGYKIVITDLCTTNSDSFLQIIAEE
jgi:hypothetical protein